jgi:hypothetical protein
MAQLSGYLCLIIDQTSTLACFFFTADPLYSSLFSKAEAQQVPTNNVFARSFLFHLPVPLTI